MQFVNRSRQLAFLVLNTGETLHLAPNEVSRQLETYETDRNPKLDRLVQLGVISPVAEPAPAKPTKSSSKS